MGLRETIEISQRGTVAVVEGKARIGSPSGAARVAIAGEASRSTDG